MIMKFNEQVHRELNKLFKAVNDKFYNSELPPANILVQTSGPKRNVLGWCTVDEVWEIGKAKYFEIVITAEFLNREFEKVVGTLMHEMVHLYNLVNKIKDTSGTEYHNKRFKTTAEERGLVIEYAQRIGWSVTALAEDTKTWLKDLKEIDRSVFDAVRKVPLKAKKKSPKTYTYTCPGCNEKVLSKNPTLYATCGECEMEFERPIRG
jgi:predicted SprT family Zn-dependent metalloprotease